MCVGAAKTRMVARISTNDRARQHSPSKNRLLEQSLEYQVVQHNKASGQGTRPKKDEYFTSLTAEKS